MSGTLAVAIKTAIITALQAAPGLDGIQVEYSDTRDMAREVVYGGQIEMTQRISGGRTADGHTTRDETGVLQLHLMVMKPGGTKQDTEARAVAIGAEVENFLALNTPTMPSGTLDASIEGYVITSWYDDDAANTLLTYRIGTSATIT